jgi:predicted cupin superfamily sugar epimerase
MIAEGLRRTLLLEGGLSAQEIFEEDLDLARHPEGGYLERAARYLETKYAGRRIGLVVAIQRPAADFLLRRVRGPLGEAPW